MPGTRAGLLGFGEGAEGEGKGVGVNLGEGISVGVSESVGVCQDWVWVGVWGPTASALAQAACGAVADYVWQTPA